jgi:hypothetical protein
MSSSKLGDILNQQAQRGGLVIPPQVLKQFQAKTGTTLFSKMKLCFQAAVVVSPIIALLPTQWTSMSVQRQYLLSVSLPLFSDV